MDTTSLRLDMEMRLCCVNVLDYLGLQQTITQYLQHKYFLLAILFIVTIAAIIHNISHKKMVPYLQYHRQALTDAGGVLL